MHDYEIRVAGAIGAVVASSLPAEFKVTAVPTSTVVSGTVTDTAEILTVLNLLDEHGLTPIDTLITPSDSVDQQAQIRPARPSQKPERTMTVLDPTRKPSTLGSPATGGHAGRAQAGDSR